jgi:hypothetical protein
MDTSVQPETRTSPAAMASGDISVPSTAAGKSDKAAHPGPKIWANGQLFNSIVTSATFSGDQGPFDALYVLEEGNTFKDGYDHLSDSAPGDQDYNVGRWEVFKLKPEADASKYDEVSSTDDPAFDHDDWTSQDAYFESPMLPNEG